MFGGLGSVLSQGLFGPNSATNVTIGALSLAAQTPGPIDIVAISGAAQTLAPAIQSLGIENRIRNITYVMPGSVGATLPTGYGQTTLVTSNGPINSMLVGNLPASANVITVHCGLNDHNPNCAFAQAGNQIKQLAGGPCSQTVTFTKGGAGGDGGGGWFYSFGGFFLFSNGVEGSVVTENSVRSENTGVPVIREMMVTTTMSSLFVALSLWSHPAFGPVMPCRRRSSRCDTNCVISGSSCAPQNLCRSQSA